MISLSLLTVALATPALVSASINMVYASPMLLSNPIQLNGNKCLAVNGGTAKVGATIAIQDCAWGASQEVTWTGSNIKIGGYCLSAQSGSSTVSLATCSSSNTNQQWYFGVFGGRYIKHNPTGKCLNLASTTNGTPITLATCNGAQGSQIFNPHYPLGHQPSKAYIDAADENGTNQCGTNSTSSALCKNLYVNSLDDFCLWGPPVTSGADGIADDEAVVVSYCLKSGRGTRMIPNGTLKGVHFVKTKDYIQITGYGDFTKMHVTKGDAGGELDPHGATGSGNPHGALVYGTFNGETVQFHEWAQFMSATEFCGKYCLGPDARKNCPHIYDEMGCYFNMPANYDTGVFESCDGDDALPAGVYGTSTWKQGVSPTPAAHPQPKSSNCVSTKTLTTGVAGSTSTSTSTSSSSTSTPTGKVIRSAVDSSKCMTAAGTTNGSKLVISTCTGSASQLFTRNGNTLRVRGLCVDVTDGVNANGTKLQLWGCGSGTNVNQQFTWDASGDKHFTWSGKGKSIDLTDGSTTNGNQLQLWTYSKGNTHQQWSF